MSIAWLNICAKFLNCATIRILAGSLGFGSSLWAEAISLQKVRLHVDLMNCEFKKPLAQKLKQQIPARSENLKVLGDVDIWIQPVSLSNKLLFAIKNSMLFLTLFHIIVPSN